MQSNTLDENTRELIAKAICYGVSLELFAESNKTNFESQAAKDYAERYVHAEWRDYLNDVEHFLYCADDSIEHPLG